MSPNPSSPSQSKWTQSRCWSQSTPMTHWSLTFSRANVLHHFSPSLPSGVHRFITNVIKLALHDSIGTKYKKHTTNRCWQIYILRHPAIKGLPPINQSLWSHHSVRSRWRWGHWCDLLPSRHQDLLCTVGPGLFICQKKKKAGIFLSYHLNTNIRLPVLSIYQTSPQ